MCAPASVRVKAAARLNGGILCDSVDFRAFMAHSSVHHAGRTRRRVGPRRGCAAGGRQPRAARPPAPDPDPRAGPRGRCGPGGGAGPRARRLRHDVRRDLEVLSDRGLLDKVHGGATSLDDRSLFEPTFVAKSSRQQAEKDAIAAAAATLVEPGMAIALSAGTTTHALARQLVDTARTHRGHQLDPRLGRPPPRTAGRTRRSSSPAASGRRRRRSSGRSRWPPCARSTSTSCSWASTAWTPTRGSPVPTSSRLTRTGRSSRRAGASWSSPTTRSGA